MSSRVTRSSARKPPNISSPNAEPPPSEPSQPPASTSRKRKAPGRRSSPDPEEPPEPAEPSPGPKPKRLRSSKSQTTNTTALETPPVKRQSKTNATPAMSSPEYGDPAQPLFATLTDEVFRQPERSDENAVTTPASAGPSKKKQGKSKKGLSPPGEPTSRITRTSCFAKLVSDPSLSTPPPTGKGESSAGSKKKKGSSGKKKTPVPIADEEATPGSPEEKPPSRDSQATPDESPDQDPDADPMDTDPFSSSGFLGRHGGPGGGLHTLRALAGMMDGVTSQMGSLLGNLRQKDDPTTQQLALQELSEILLVSTEDNLAGQFSPDQYVKEFVTLMQTPEGALDNPEMMLLACRCIANLIEALPAATATVVYSGAVPVLIKKLTDIVDMDLAEQALTTLQKISAEFPSSIVREKGLAACLQYLDFFPTSTQRTAVTTAANCCRNIPEDSFTGVEEVMPNLLNVLNSSDQRVVEQGSLCVSRIVKSFERQDDKLERLMNGDLLQTILRLLLPGSTNLVSAHIHTQFLRVLSITARASPRLTVELLRLNVTDTLYQILTGVSPPGDDENVAQNIDSVVVMQALIHRPKDQVFETLNVICEILPSYETTKLESLRLVGKVLDPIVKDTKSISKDSPASKRLKMLSDCKTQLRRFATVLLPTLTDAYSSTVNMDVRKQVLAAQLTMLLNLDQEILEDALRPVPYASFLASILSQQDHAFMVADALNAADILLQRLGSVYRYQFYREGVMAEVQKLADRALDVKPDVPKQEPAVASHSVASQAATASTVAPAEDKPAAPNVPRPTDDEDVDMNDSEDDVYPTEIAEDMDEDPDRDDSDDESSESPPPSENTWARPGSVNDMITRIAKQFMLQHDSDNGSGLGADASRRTQDLNNLVSDVSDCYEGDGSEGGAALFARLAKSFEGSALESITSYELLSSNIIHTLLDLFDTSKGSLYNEARSAFVEAFMGSNVQSSIRTASSVSPTTPFSILVHKLQDLLSRAEHFEVLTVNSSPVESSRGGAASVLAKQVRIKLVAEGDDSGIPAHFKNIMVSIHAIATLKALDEYLRPRMSLSEEPRSRRQRDPPSRSAVALSEALSSRRMASTPMLPPGRSVPTLSGLGSDPTQTSRQPPAVDEGAKPESSAVAAADTPTTRKSARKTTRSGASQGASTPPHSTTADPTDVTPEIQAALDSEDEDDVPEVEADDEEMTKSLNDVRKALAKLDEDAEDDEGDPSAVSMEVASSGQVTARQDDGTRVVTPTHPPAQSSNVAAGRPTPGSLARSLFSSRAMTYAAAIQSVPTDWHLEFSVSGKRVSSDTTIYRAIHSNFTGEVSGRNVWSSIHSITFKKVPGPPPAESSTLTPSPASPTGGTSDLPQSLDKNPTTAAILRLLSILHDINANLDEVLGDGRTISKISPEPLSQFVNTKLTAKMNRQLEEPLIVASNSLPNWSEDLARLYPFLFPFETRHLFLQSTSFGYSRSITRWQNAQPQPDSRRERHRDERPFLGRLQRQKVRISRGRLLESAIKVLELYGASPSILEVEYFNEVGTGLGPTLEFYSNVSKEFSKKKLRLWRENESAQSEDYAFGKKGLFPAPMNDPQLATDNGKRVLMLFRMLGKFMARSMLDSRIVEVSLNPTFFRIDLGANAASLSLEAIRSIDEDLANSLQTLKQFAAAKKKIIERDSLTHAQKAQKISRIQVAGAGIEDLGLDFTLPGHPSIELISNGANTAVNIDNVGQYVEKVIDYTLYTGVKQQVEAFRTGFSQVFPYSALRAFTPDELCMLFGRVEEDWSIEGKVVCRPTETHND